MACPKCGGPTVWSGSLSRGNMVCPSCDSVASKNTKWHGGEQVSPVIYRYRTEVHSWHRKWCAASRAVQQGKARRTDAAICDCGHTQKVKLTDAEIEQMEIANYGMV